MDQTRINVFQHSAALHNHRTNTVEILFANLDSRIELENHLGAGLALADGAKAIKKLGRKRPSFYFVIYSANNYM